jgi:hypothetical protein
MHTLNSAGIETSGGHVFPVFGYRPITDNGQPSIELLVYDTWNEDYVINPNTQQPYENTSYRIVKFPNADEIPYRGTSTPATGYFTRASDLMRFKIFGFCFLRINDLGRCPDALQPIEYPSNIQQNPYTGALDIGFNVTFDEDSLNRRVHFTLDGKDPNPNSPYLAINGSTGTLHIGSNCNLKLRTYADADQEQHPEDGYLAGKVIDRTYWVSPSSTALAKYADGDEVIGGSMVVTKGTTDSDHYCYLEDENRLSGVRVEVGDTTTVAQGAVVSVSGTFTTTTDGERVIRPAVLQSEGTATATITPLGMPNRSLGGADFNYSSTTGAGQQGVTDGAGLNNIGLLVLTTGCVCESDTSTFSITDGSGGPITVITPDNVTPPESGYVGVTGVCSIQSDGNDGFKPVLLVRTEDDIVTYDAETCSCGSPSNAPARPRPEAPVIDSTDMIAWALRQDDGTAVTVKACGVRSASTSGLLIDDGWMKGAARIWVPGNWTVEEWSTIDVAGTLTTLPDETRAIAASQIWVYTDARGRIWDFPFSWRDHFGRLVEEWPYKQEATKLSQ